MEVNTTLLRQTMNQIRAFPELHDQNVFFKDTDCGTAACFAGWVCILSGYQPVIDGSNFRCFVSLPEGHWVPAWETAQELLGLTDEQACVLFSPLLGPSDLEAVVADLIVDGELSQHKDYHHECVPF